MWVNNVSLVQHNRALEILTQRAFRRSPARRVHLVSTGTTTYPNLLLHFM